MTRVGVLLSGSGVQDGAEIHESVVTLLALDEAGAKVRCLAPDKPQTKVTNHLEGKDSDEARNVLVESARIARGAAESVSSVSPADLDGLILPGGFGAALNLCDFGIKGEGMSVDPDVEKLLLGMHEAGKPIAALCIAPVILARLFGRQKARLTIGNDPDTAAKIEAMGAEHVDCDVSGCVVDEKNRLVTTPAYMLAASIKEISPGIRKAVTELLRLAGG